MCKKEQNTEATAAAAAKAKAKSVNDGVQMILLDGNGELSRTGQTAEAAAGQREKGYKSIIRLEGLGCASCAATMETEINKLAGVESAAIDFVHQKLYLQTDLKANLTRLMAKIEGIVKKIEPDVLVKMDADADSDANANINADTADFVRHDQVQLGRLILGGALFAAALVLSLPQWLELTLYLVSYAIVGGGVVFRALKDIVRGQVFSEHFLMSVATIGAFLIGEYPEGVAVMLFYLVGEMFQDRAIDRSRKSIAALMDIKPDYANRQVGSELIKVSPEKVNIGDLIVIKPGEKVPLDGQVRTGQSWVDTSALTGESRPRELKPGSEILSGFINQSGVLTVEVTKPFGESTVSKILDLVQNARHRKASAENFITKFARYYTPAVVLCALTLALLPPLLIEGAVFADWTYRALVFLVVSCPCALVISIPLGFFGGLGGASKRGVLIKGGNYLEALNQVEAAVFDKTGTLTKGVFKVTGINPQKGFTEAELLEYAAYAESHSSHPIALSIINAYRGLMDLKRLEKYTEIAGQGVQVRLNGQEVWVGNARLMASGNIECQYNEAETLGTVVHVAVDQKYAGHLVISDEAKADAALAIKELKSLGIKNIVMLTGDLKRIGAKLGQQLGFDTVYAELLPTDKVEKLEWLMERKKSPKGKIVYVGDGINDAPVLARADIGIAMGGLGSDAAIEAADIVIMNDEPSKLAAAIKIARKTRRIVYQNIFFALGVKAVFLILGAMGIATMWEAVFGDVGVALIAIFNAMRVMNTDGF